jgi:hypothetical protein
MANLPLVPRLRALLRSPIEPDAPDVIVAPEEEWEVTSVLGATPSGLFGASALRYDVFSSKEVAEQEARALEAVTGQETIVRTPAEGREAVQKEQEDFERRMERHLERSRAFDEDLAASF